MYRRERMRGRMKKWMKNGILTAVMVGSMTAVAPMTDVLPMAVCMADEQGDESTVKWEADVQAVEAIGIGLPPENANKARGRALARRAAIVDAQRNLLEEIEGVQVDAETTVEDLTIASDTIRTKVSGLLQGAKVVEEKYNVDGSYEVKIILPLFGETGSVASVVLPAVAPAQPAPIPEPRLEMIPQAKQEEVVSLQYTGLVIDATGLDLKATFSPVIYDTNGRAIYGMANIDPDFAISKGMVSYAKNTEEACGLVRVGTNPLVLKAVSVRGGKNSENKVNVVVTPEDGDVILLANAKSGMLEKCAVVFVK